MCNVYTYGHVNDTKVFIFPSQFLYICLWAFPIKIRLIVSIDLCLRCSEPEVYLLFEFVRLSTTKLLRGLFAISLLYKI